MQVTPRDFACKDHLRFQSSAMEAVQQALEAYVVSHAVPCLALSACRLSYLANTILPTIPGRIDGGL